MSKKRKQLLDLIIAQVQKQLQPGHNPAEDRLQEMALADAEDLKGGNLPKSTVYNLDAPVQGRNAIFNTMNAAQNQVSAFNDAGTASNDLSGKLFSDNFARLAMGNKNQNFQTAGANALNALGGAADSKRAGDFALINAVQHAYDAIPKSPGFMQYLPGILNAATSVMGAVSARTQNNQGGFSPHGAIERMPDLGAHGFGMPAGI